MTTCKCGGSSMFKGNKLVCTECGRDKDLLREIRTKTNKKRKL